MKFPIFKTLAACSVLAAGAGLSLLFGGGTQTVFAAEELPQGDMVSSVQTDALGNEVELDILKTADGKYALADAGRQIYVYNMKNNTSTELKELYTSDTGVFDDPYAVSAFKTVVASYDFYADEENLGVSIRGIEGENGQIPIQVLLHYDYGLANASYFFDEEQEIAFFRIGDGNPFGSVYRTAAATDVLAHEYQHAITERCGGLVYLNQSGAISEAISDIFGALIEGHEPTEAAFWQTGEDAAPAGQAPMRSAIMPGENYRLNATNLYPACERNHIHESCDYGGVHYNSTVLTHMQYNLWRKLPSYFTRERIGRLWYATLCKLTPKATMREFAACFEAAAEELGFDETALGAISDTLFESGITAEGNYHMVTFYQYAYNGRLSYVAADELSVRHGGSAPAPEDPPEVVTESAIYTFARWLGNIEVVTQDVLARADYSKTDRIFTVRFEDENGNFLAEEQHLYGEAATPPALPPKEESKVYLYPFLGWDHPLDFVTGDFTARPVYGQEYRLYEATYLSDGKLLARVLVHYETELDLPDLSEQSRNETERFAGWYLDEDCTVAASSVKVTAPITLYAKWVENEERDSPSVAGIVVPVVCVCAVPLGFLLAWFITKKKKKK